MAKGSVKENSKEITVFFDRVGNTLDVWFGKPRKAISEEKEEEFLIKRDIKTGEVVGFEKFNVFPKKSLREARVLVEEI
ncbi:MAG TPA: DUF2283 domain-containing protein [Nanoarchaeota archaeon]|nr:DUF2283 domain-containing protein [Candidatus Pacearchaeota archaeon]HIH18055.1 DUF2283 domain-containing protein [Nanoarchaeota archaeon]HIH34745.1 DUF2283 domain-containing protein [Nanoarchaeota archaeon]HIH51348.1 DUF2283 domain-containing protein [Nanoarchaeota archaeon]HIH66325.1 DUF2283 domain-containing protein [Nanoarchaeota archaeon]